MAAVGDASGSRTLDAGAVRALRQLHALPVPGDRARRRRGPAHRPRALRRLLDLRPEVLHRRARDARPHAPRRRRCARREGRRPGVEEADLDSLLITNGTVVTLGTASRVLHGHDVLCEGGRIARIAPHGAISAGGARVIDAAGKLVLPGFINAHTHFYTAFARGLGKAAPSATFREVLEHLWWRLDRALDLEDCRLSALVTAIDAVRHGTTTLIDHHASPHAVRGSLDALAAAAGQVGVRACLCYEVSDRDGEAIAREGIAENAAFAARCRRERDPLLRGVRPARLVHALRRDAGARRGGRARARRRLPRPRRRGGLRPGALDARARRAGGRAPAPPRRPRARDDRRPLRPRRRARGRAARRDRHGRRPQPAVEHEQRGRGRGRAGDGWPPACSSASAPTP